MKTKLIVFDLDGTLLNTLKDLQISLNKILKKHNMPLKDEESYKKMVGNGIAKLVSRASNLEESSELFSIIKDEFNEYYKEHCNDYTKPYNGIEQMLKEVKKRGIKIAVLSNKDDNFVKELIKIHFSDITFDYIMGKRKEYKPKPDPGSLNHIIKTLKIEKQSVLYVGDSNVDVKTAKNCSVECIGVKWGFREEKELKDEGVDYVINEPNEILRYIK